MQEGPDISYYLDLQRRMFEIFAYVSCHEGNFATYSLRLESLLVDIGAFFDSLCQTFIRERHAQGHRFKGEIGVRRFSVKASGTKDFKGDDYRELLEAEFHCSSKEVNILAYEHEPAPSPPPPGGPPLGMPVVYKTPLEYLILPFSEWGSGKSTVWWRAFTRLKHDRLKSRAAATMGNTINALGGVLIVLMYRNQKLVEEAWVPDALFHLFWPKFAQPAGARAATVSRRLKL